MTTTAEFDCEGCGVHVIGFGRDAPPPGGWMPEPRHTPPGGSRLNKLG
jgi:hypothetical protein